MTPESANYLLKAAESLDEARQISAIGLFKPAARAAYYTAFHAAEALIFERTGKIAKTHSGVRSEFARIGQPDPRLDQTYFKFIADSYRFKEISDYSVDPHATVTKAECARLIEGAEHFLNTIVKILG